MLMGSANYSVSGMGLDSKRIGGCVHLDYKKPGESLTKTFTLWLGQFQHGKQLCRQEGTRNKLLFYTNTEFYATTVKAIPVCKQYTYL